MKEQKFFHRRCLNCQSYLPYFQGRVWFHPPRGLCTQVPPGVSYDDHRWGWDVCKEFKEKPFAVVPDNTRAARC